jgi:hypothetical protein
LPEVVSVLELQLVEPAGAAPSRNPTELFRIGGVGYIPQHQPAEERFVVPASAANLDTGRGDIVTRERTVLRAEHDHVLDRGARWVLKPSHVARIKRVPCVHDGDSAVIALRTEPLLAALTPVGEAPLANVGEPLVEPDVGVEAAAAEIVMPNCNHVLGFPRLASSLEGLIHLLQPMNLVFEEFVLVLARGRHSDAREEK